MYEKSEDELTQPNSNFRKFLYVLIDKNIALEKFLCPRLCDDCM